MKDVYKQLLEELEKGESPVLGTLIVTRGSTPQVTGASAMFNKKGLMCGTLGGGVIEAEAVTRAKSVYATGKNVLGELSLNSDFNEKNGAICGGNATFLLDANPSKSIEVFKKLGNAIEKNLPGLLLTIIQGSDKSNCSVQRFWLDQNDLLPEEVIRKTGIKSAEIEHLLKRKFTGVLNYADKNTIPSDVLVFAETIFPLPELVIVGAGHIGQALCHLGKLVDFSVILIDNRPDLATLERFPDATRIICGDFESSFRKINISENTYLVIVTQGHNSDAEALRLCVNSNAAYIGMIGSKRKTSLMKQKFLDERWATETEISRIFAPVGIDIHSVTVQEIAISICAQLVNERHLHNRKKQEAKIAGIVLAAGESKRMNRQKMLLPFEGSTIIETVVDKAIQSNIPECFVVLGSHAESIKKQLEGRAVQFIENRDYQTGMLSSVISGINRISTETDAAIILLGDQPMVEIQVINQLIKSYLKSLKGIVIPVYRAKRGHPILIDLKYREEINNLNPEVGLRELMMNRADDILEIEVDSEKILNDIDTPEDYKKQTN